MDKSSAPLLLDAGDFLFKLQASPSKDQVAGARLLLDLYREMGYQALCVGTKDLANSLAFLKGEAEARGLRLLSANLYQKGFAVFPPFHIFNVQGLKVGVMGLTAPLNSGLLKGIDVRNPFEVCSELLPGLRKQVDICIILSNLGYTADRNLARTLNGIDIIIGSGSGGKLSRPVKVGNTYILRGDIKGKTIGRAEITWEGANKRIKLKNYIIKLDERVLPDEKVRDRVRAVSFSASNR